jgi:hypothetical protein
LVAGLNQTNTIDSTEVERERLLKSGLKVGSRKKIFAQRRTGEKMPLSFLRPVALTAMTVLLGGGTAYAQMSAPSSSIAPMTSPSPVPTTSAAEARDQLGKLDAAAQAIVRNKSVDSNHSYATEIFQSWPRVRSALVGRGANRSDLIAADSAVQSLQAAVAASRNPQRAANAVTAAFAPMYAALGDLVPARIHRLDFIHRSLMLDVAERDWTRATSDVISARSTWRAVRKIVTDRHAQREGDLYNAALNAVEDGINARNVERFTRSITRADVALGAIEKALDHQEPAWRKFLHNFGM